MDDIILKENLLEELVADAPWNLEKVATDAKSGDIDAMCGMGERYWFGDLAELDREKAVLWCSLAAQNLNAYAMCCLGYAYATGTGVK